MSHIDFREHCKIWAYSVEKYKYLFDMNESMQVRQEDLISNPDEVFRAVLSFIGLGYEEGPTRFSQTTLIHPLDQKTKTNVDVKKALSQRLPSYSDWNDDEKKIFLEICGESMQKLGYEIPF
jgi:hypothetical protein